MPSQVIGKDHWSTTPQQDMIVPGSNIHYRRMFEQTVHPRRAFAQPYNWSGIHIVRYYSLSRAHMALARSNYHSHRPRRYSVVLHYLRTPIHQACSRRHRYWHIDPERMIPHYTALQVPTVHLDYRSERSTRRYICVHLSSIPPKALRRPRPQASLG